MCLLDKGGFLETTKGFRQAGGFHTGDRVKVVVSTGKKAGPYLDWVGGTSRRLFLRREG